MALKKIHAFGHTFDIGVSRQNGKLNVVVTSEGKKVFRKLVREGETVEVEL